MKFLLQHRLLSHQGRGSGWFVMFEISVVEPMKILHIAIGFATHTSNHAARSPGNVRSMHQQGEIVFTFFLKNEK